MRKYIFIAILLSTMSLMAQNMIDSIKSYTANLNYQAEMPKLIPPSPETASLLRYLEYSLDHTSGAMTLSIPIYKIKYGTLSLLVTINYEGSGRRITDVTGPIGMGWSLNTGGIISRTIKGKPDNRAQVDQVKIEKLLDSKTKNNYYEYIDLTHELYYENIYDSEYDIFNYNISGFSGSFIIKDGTPVKLDNNPVLITVNSSYNEFTVTDDKGVRYFFIGSEWSDAGMWGNQITGWHLSSITSADGIYTIRFRYNTQMAKIKPKLPSESLVVRDRVSNGIGIFPYSYVDQIKTSPTSYNYETKRLEEISFGENSLFFNIDKDNIVNLITLKNGNKRIKQLELTHSYLDAVSSQSNYKLDKLIWKGSDDKVIEQYKFDYITSSSFSTYDADYWGFRNGTFRSGGIFPNMQIKYQQDCNSGNASLSIGGANRSPSPQEAEKGILRRITYPTGGYSEFYYEGNTYINNNIEKGGGGIRLKEVKTFDQNGNSILKNYKYGPGSLKLYPEYLVDNMTEFYMLYFNNTVESGDDRYTYGYRQKIYSSEFGSELSYFAQLPIFYSVVTEYVNNHLINEKYATKYTYNNRNIGTVTSNWLNPSSEDRDAKCRFLSAINCSFENSYSRRYGSYYDYFWKKNDLIKKEEMKNDGTGKGYITLKSTYFHYNETILDTFVCAILSENIKFPTYQDHMTENLKYVLSLIFYDNPRFPVFTPQSYLIIKGIRELTSVEETIYTDVGNVVSKTEYIYNKQSLPSEIKTKTSDGKTIVESIKYPADLSVADVYKNMVSKNMLNFPIKKIRSVDSKFTESITIDYKLFKSFFYLPGSVSLNTTGNSPDDMRITYHDYDKYGNPIYITKDDADKIVYLWSYSGQYLVAEIKGSTYEEVKNALGKNPEDLSTTTSPDITLINGLRTKLPNAIVTTYTYKPLVGILTATDPRGATTYYEYDSYGRLSLTKDPKEKAIRKNEYNYARELYPPISLFINGDASANIKRPFRIMSYARGGSGNYLYEWTIKNSSGNILWTEKNSKNASISYIQNVKTDYLYISCSVTDAITGESKTADYKLRVLYSPIEFSNVRKMSDGSVCAQIKSDMSFPVKFRITMKSDAISDSFYAVYRIGGYYNQFYAPIDEYVTVTLNQGIADISIDFRRDTHPGMTTKRTAILEIYSVDGDANKGTYTTISATNY